MYDLKQILNIFCGDCGLTIFDKNDYSFSFCFEVLVFNLIPFLILAATSSYYIGNLRTPDIHQRVPYMFQSRKLYSFFTLILILIQLFKDLILFNGIPTPVGFMCYGLRIISLTIHTAYLHRLSLVHFEYYRGPIVTTLSWCFTFPSYIVSLQRVIASFFTTFTLSTLDVSLLVDFFLFILMLSCQCMYLVTLVQKNSKYKTVSILSQRNEHVLDHQSIQNLLYNLEEESRDNVCPSHTSNWFSFLFFHWVQPLMKLGKEENLTTPLATYHLPPKLQTEKLCKKFTEKLKIEFLSKFEDPNVEDSKNRVLLKTLYKQFGKWYLFSGLLNFFASTVAFAAPIFLNLLVKYIEFNNEPLVNGCLYAAGLFLASFIQSILSTHFSFQMNKIGVAAKSSMTAAVFSKTLSAKNAFISHYSTGEITNLMNTDVDRVVNFFPSFHQFWGLPLQVIITLILLYEQVGLVFLASLTVAILMIVFNRFLAKQIGKYNVGMMKYKDERIKLMTEILIGIRSVKNFCWEDILSSHVEKIRKKELKSLRGLKYMDAGCVYLWASTPIIISLFTFSLFSVFGDEFTAAKVFTVIALINMLISPLNAFPWVVNGLMEALTSLNRLEKFLSIEDVDLDDYYDDISEEDEDCMCLIENGNFVCNSTNENTSSMFQLKDICLKIDKGNYIGVVGTVGSGKSSLLMAISGQLRKLSGKICLRNYQNSVAYVSQEVWLQHDTIRQNILWGKEYEEDFYNDVIKACALVEDLQMLPGGDLTEVGENGMTLSGGQKARISLARAIYQDKSVYLLDDPFSALDEYVSAYIFKECICGLLALKTVVLSTHHLKYLENAKFVVKMNQGFSEIISPNDLIFDGEFLQFSQTPNDEIDVSYSNKNQIAVPQIYDEEKAFGSLNIRVYGTYWRSIGQLTAFTILIFVVLMRATKITSDWWLSRWVSSNKSDLNLTGQLPNWFQNPSPLKTTEPLTIIEPSTFTILPSSGLLQTPPVYSPMWYLMVYGLLAAGNSIITLIRAFLFAYGGLKAAKKMHRKILASILNAPVSFFDITPIGRVINRFSSDMYTIDDSLPFILNIFLSQFVGLIGTLIITCYGLHLIAVLLLPLGVCYYFIQKYYRCTSRELKRFSSITLSPIYAHYQDTLAGLNTISAFRNSEIFIKHNLEIIAINQRCTYSSYAAVAWLSTRLQMIGVVLIGGVGAFAVFQHNFTSVAPGLVGLALSYALSVTGNLSGAITSFTETEKEFVSVERQSYYIDQIPQERIRPLSFVTVTDPWPVEGKLEFRSVYLRYSSQNNYALQGVNFIINPGEKIGIIGRTGSGKSSLLTALFRLKPLLKGTIFIDGINIAKLSLKDLRSRITIIRQDPFLLSSSIRLNLDPCSEFDDTKLWWSLDCCGMLGPVEDIGGLDAEVGERGQKFSVGQRQLLCMARCLLKKSKILCLDEATANIDEDSERLVMTAIENHFDDCTILSIAHRKETIRNCDRILVMKNGSVETFRESRRSSEDSNVES